jgi:hypothetical protein
MTLAEGTAITKATSKNIETTRPPAYVSGWPVERRPAMVVEFLAWLGSRGLRYSLVSLRFAYNFNVI